MTSQRILVLKFHPLPPRIIPNLFSRYITPKTEMPGLSYPGIAWSMDMGHYGKGHTSLQKRPSLKELIAFPEVRVTNPSLNSDLGSISLCPLQLKPIRTLQGLSRGSLPIPHLSFVAKL